MVIAEGFRTRKAIWWRDSQNTNSGRRCTIAFLYANIVNTFIGSRNSGYLLPLTLSWHALLEPGLIFVLKLFIIVAGFGLRWNQMGLRHAWAWVARSRIRPARGLFIWGLRVTMRECTVRDGAAQLDERVFFPLMSPASFLSSLLIMSSSPVTLSSKWTVEMPPNWPPCFLSCVPVVYFPLFHSQHVPNKIQSNLQGL